MRKRDSCCNVGWFSTTAKGSQQGERFQMAKVFISNVSALVTNLVYQLHDFKILLHNYAHPN